MASGHGENGDIIAKSAHEFRNDADCMGRSNRIAAQSVLNRRLYLDGLSLERGQYVRTSFCEASAKAPCLH